MQSKDTTHWYTDKADRICLIKAEGLLN
jgi:hypothetical protein